MWKSMAFGRQARQLPRGAVLLQPHHHQPILLARHFAASASTPPTEKQDNAGDHEEISTIKSKIREALRHRKDDVTLNHVKEFFNLKSVTVFDCNKILKSCWLNSNAKVAKFTWKSMVDRHIDLNAFSVACLLTALSKGGYLDEALDLLKQLGRKIKAVQPHIIFCGIFLNGCSLTGSAFYAEKCLQFIKESALQEDELVYLELMKLAGKRKDLPAVQKAWTLMVKTCKPSMPTLDSYCAAVKALCQVGAFNEALVALREMVQMVSKNENFTLISEKKMKIKFFTKEEGVGKQEEIFEKRQTGERIAIDDFIKGDTESLNNTSGVDQFLELPEEDSLNNEESESASKLPHAQLLGWTQLAMLNMEQTEMDNLPESLQSVGNPISGFFSDKFDKVKILLRHAFNAIINAAVQKGDLQSAELLFSQMRAVNLKPDRYSYNAMLRAVVRGRGLEQGFQVIENMVKNGLEPDTKSYNAILEGFCSNLELNKAEALLDRMLNSDSYKPSDFSFNVLLKACADLDDLKRALRVFTKMVEAGVKPDQRTILYLLTAFGRVNAYYEKGTEDSQKELSHRLSAIESYMEYANVSHSLQTFNAMLVALSAEGMADEVVQRLRLAEGYVDERGISLLDAITFNTAMNACIQTGQWDAALEIFERMSKVGLKANTDTYNVLINGCAERQTIEDALHFWDTMLEDGLKPNLLTYNSLIKVYCYSDDLDGAVNILTDMDEARIQPDAVTYVTLLASSCKRERLDMVEFLVEHMHRQNIEPNITVCEHVVMAYLNCHQVDDAAEALRVLSIWMLPKGGELRKQMEDVLKHIFSEDSLDVESSTLHLLKDVLVNKGLVSEALFAVRLSGFGSTFVGAWNADESPWARRLSRQYAPGHVQ